MKSFSRYEHANHAFEHNKKIGRFLKKLEKCFHILGKDDHIPVIFNRFEDLCKKTKMSGSAFRANVKKAVEAGYLITVFGRQKRLIYMAKYPGQKDHFELAISKLKEHDKKHKKTSEIWVVSCLEKSKSSKCFSGIEQMILQNRANDFAKSSKCFPSEPTSKPTNKGHKRVQNSLTERLQRYLQKKLTEGEGGGDLILNLPSGISRRLSPPPLNLGRSEMETVSNITFNQPEKETRRTQDAFPQQNTYEQSQDIENRYSIPLRASHGIYRYCDFRSEKTTKNQQKKVQK